jgi:transcriptional regulator with XRE-family HTH domain
MGGDSLIATNIGYLCKAHGTTFAEVERAVGLGNGVIRRWDEYSPRVESLKLVADYFNVSIDELMREEETNAKG